MSMVSAPDEQDIQIPVAELLDVVLDRGASDLHLTVGAPPTIRLHGDLERLEEYPIMTPRALQGMIYAILPQKMRERLEQEHERCIVNQREVGADTHSFSQALKHVLRQDPDVILVGEMRDLETIATAITAAETGHLVFATLHTQDAPQTIDRIIDVFPPHQQQQVRVQLATTLQGVVTQQLLQTVDGRGRAVAVEILVTTPAVRNLIREGKVHQIYSIMQAGGRFGMQTMDQSLANLVKAGKVTQPPAYEPRHHPEELNRLIGGSGASFDGGMSAAAAAGNGARG